MLYEYIANEMNLMSDKTKIQETGCSEWKNIIIYHSYCSVHLTVSNYRFFVVSVANVFECRKIVFSQFNNFLNAYQKTKMYRMANIRSAQKDNHVSKKGNLFCSDEELCKVQYERAICGIK